jgi:hypothetical protein
MRYPQHAIARNLKRGVSKAVTLERRAGVVEALPVEFDYQTLVMPHGVDLHAREKEVHRRAW